MKKFFIIILILIFSTNTYANKNKNTWDYPLIDYRGWVIKGSKDHYKFQSDLREDKDVLKEFKNNVQFQKSRRYGDFVSARYSFYADRYDYLRIAKTMMEDWHNDTCAGKYLKNIYENRIKRKIM